MTRLLAPLTPGSKISDRQTIAEVLVHVTYSMLNFSIRDGQSHPDAVVQLKTLLTGYLVRPSRGRGRPTQEQDARSARPSETRRTPALEIRRLRHATPESAM